MNAAVLGQGEHAEAWGFGLRCEYVIHQACCKREQQSARHKMIGQVSHGREHINGREQLLPVLLSLARASLRQTLG